MRKIIRNFIVAVLVVLTAVLPCGVISASADSLKMGDVDGNGHITSIDALTIQRHIVRLIELTDTQKQVADINGDGKVSLIDAMRILRYISGYSDSIIDSSDDSADVSDAFVKEVVRLVNLERAKEGISPLTLDETLCKASALRAKETEAYFSHVRPNGQSWSTVLSEYNISFSTAGENIAAGQTTPAAVVKAWMDSEGHRANIMNPSYTKIGVGYYFKSDSTYGHYWEQLFVG